MTDQADPFSRRLEEAGTKQCDRRCSYFMSREHFLNHAGALSVFASIFIVCVSVIAMAYPHLKFREIEPAGSLFSDQTNEALRWLALVVPALWAGLNMLPLLLESLYDAWAWLHTVLRARREYVDAKRIYQEARKEFVRSFKPKGGEPQIKN